MVVDEDMIDQCVIVAAGTFQPKDIPKDLLDHALIIAADAGLNYLKRMNVTPQIAIGDWDSLIDSSTHENIERKVVEQYLAQAFLNESETVILPVQKDESDVMAAVKLGIERGCKTFHLFGCLGGSRVDHSIANLQTIYYLHQNGLQGYLYSSTQVMTLIEEESIMLTDVSNAMNEDVSLFAFLGQTEHVSIKGLRYEVEDVTLTSSYPFGVSNSLIDSDAIIKVGKGPALIVYPQHIICEKGC